MADSTPQTRQDVLSLTTPEPSNAILSTLENWKHVVGMVQDHIGALQSTQKHVTAGLERARKAVADAPKFTEAEAGSATKGVAEAFQVLRANADELLNKSAETEDAYLKSVVGELETLRADIDKHIKGLKGNNFKNLKDIEKARLVTRKHIETLGQHSSSSAGGSKPEPKNDPYVLHRVTQNAIDDQLQKENLQSNAALSSQNNLKTLQTHIIAVLKNATQQVDAISREFTDVSSSTHAKISEAFGSISEDHEWDSFLKHHADEVVPDTGIKRGLTDVSFSNDAHPSTAAITEGILERKGGKLLKSYNSGYYVLTPSGYLHEFKSQNHVQDPTPEFSLYVPEATLGAISNTPGKYKFTITGKSSSKASLGSKHNYSFKAATQAELQTWYESIKRLAAGSVAGLEDSDVSSPTSPGGESLPSTAPNSRVASGVGAVPPPTAEAGTAAKIPVDEVVAEAPTAKVVADPTAHPADVKTDAEAAAAAASHATSNLEEGVANVHIAP